MLDTLTERFAPQYRNDPHTYMGLLLDRMTPYRAVPGKLLVRVAPDDSNAQIAPNGTWEGRFAVPRQSRLWGITGSSSEAAGFDIQLRSGDTFQPLLGRRVAFDNLCGGNGKPVFLPKPMLMMIDGDQQAAHLIVQIWNKAAALNSIQVVFWFRAPLDGEQA